MALASRTWIVLGQDDLPAIPARPPEASFPRLEHHDTPAVPSKAKRAGKPRIAGADDAHIGRHALGEGLRVRRWRCGLRPERGGEGERLGHHSLLAIMITAAAVPAASRQL